MLLLYSLNSIPPNDFSNSLDQRYHAHLVVRCEHNLVVKCDKPVGRVVPFACSVWPIIALPRLDLPTPRMT